MREIKFRAWFEASHMMEPFDFNSIYDDGYRDGEYGDDDGTVYLKPDVRVMQYTGLKDKNGVEIYEGDIVAIYPHCATEYKLEDANICEVKWSDENCGWVGIFGNIASWSKHEVIGNIYEKPELLEEKPNE